MDALHGVEDDVEKKRHMKNPWKESYQSFLGSSFGPSSDMAPASTQERQRSVDLQHEISKSSLNVHIRLELLQRQIDDLAKASTNVRNQLAFKIHV
ncbi:hypothetical protein SPRG_02650 [Saprolegnia parasitica CBS 223.65]|uniref:Uncharacterized protein n=1 Tax=Saprolegnia parasitica (strain CBS 223.65) TaxID=695850 RepID=A0A067D1P3_SAPPC|nr:hypothetical protein SPRG_02650 [Saprolegnia parasitica CBS 223.65]KDO32957.1 hypothetical protein SPRG_02650 [Saprolegnia parasitica CBS 223.65]|eukprot:XP_012196604.1 hypothetical protein SPRG_02650 [Saprolegnia parasitica CBS 223.65]